MGSGDVCLITVVYRTTAGIRRLLDSLKGQRSLERLRVVVVNNGATDESRRDLDEVVRSYPGRIEILHSLENLWYWRASALALDRELRDPGRDATWFVICNDDVVLTDPGFIEELSRLDPATHPVVAPDIVSAATGERQNPAERLPMTRLDLVKWKLYYTHYWVARAMLGVHGVLVGDRPPGEPSGSPRVERIHAPHGACMVLAHEFFARGGTMDTGFTAYGEETSVAAMARRLDLPVVYVPRLKVLHAEHATVGKELTRTIYSFQKQAYEHCRRTYGELLTR